MPYSVLVAEPMKIIAYCSGPQNEKIGNTVIDYIKKMHLTRMKLRLLFKNWRISCISILTHTQKVSKCRNKLLTSIHNCMQTDNHRRIQSQLHINNVLPYMQRIQPFVSYTQYAETHITKFVFKGYTKLLCELAYNGVSEKVHSTIIYSIARKCFKTNIP